MVYHVNRLSFHEGFQVSVQFLYLRLCCFVENIIQTLFCGLNGPPPSNGVLPQSPMDTESLAVLRRQLIRRKMVKSAKGMHKETSQQL